MTTANPTIHYFSVLRFRLNLTAGMISGPGQTIERHHVRIDDGRPVTPQQIWAEAVLPPEPDDRPLPLGQARSLAAGIAEEVAHYAKVSIDWTTADAPDGDGWIVTSSQNHKVIDKWHVRYLGIVDPDKPRRDG